MRLPIIYIELAEYESYYYSSPPEKMPAPSFIKHKIWMSDEGNFMPVNMADIQKLAQKQHFCNFFQFG